jgi:6-phosphogluconolactonase (cycloisomerase 2 family)
MKHGTRLPVLGCLALLVAGCSAAAPAAPSRGPFVYVANKGRDSISQFAAPPSSGGALRPLSTLTVPAGPFPYTIAVDPQGTSAYATSSASKVYQYTINAATGKLTPKSPATVATRSGGTAAIAFTPNGRSAYAVGTSISQYSIDAITGKLTPKSPATVATPPNPEPIAVSPNGKYAYVATCGGCGYAHQKTPSRASADPASAKPEPAKPSYLVEYRINPRTGVLSPEPVAKTTTGNGANWIAIAPNGQSVYVATSAGVWPSTTS